MDLPPRPKPSRSPTPASSPCPSLEPLPHPPPGTLQLNAATAAPHAPPLPAEHGAYGGVLLRRGRPQPPYAVSLPSLTIGADVQLPGRLVRRAHANPNPPPHPGPSPSPSPHPNRNHDPNPNPEPDPSPNPEPGARPCAGAPVLVRRDDAQLARGAARRAPAAGRAAAGSRRRAPNPHPHPHSNPSPSRRPSPSPNPKILTLTLTSARAERSARGHASRRGRCGR